MEQLERDMILANRVSKEAMYQYEILRQIGAYNMLERSKVIALAELLGLDELCKADYSTIITKYNALMDMYDLDRDSLLTDKEFTAYKDRINLIVGDLDSLIEKQKDMLRILSDSLKYVS